ncbi:unnamed protein product [Anisakis simplex]|uniref:Cadherin domain-containing protein n=1 Tax=Anisakis simplex TaxID=6269 RepID=A0A0M3JI31_ANISI|nr:unnamed protein product [Anisakis simplex]
MEALGNEVARDFSIIIAARSGQMSNYATLSVTLLDENDHPPKFLQSEYSVKILASSPIGTVAVHVQAHDPDNGQNGVIRYAIAAGTLQLFESILGCILIFSICSSVLHLLSVSLRATHSPVA